VTCCCITIHASVESLNQGDKAPLKISFGFERSPGPDHSTMQFLITRKRIGYWPEARDSNLSELRFT
jgi:hypothetical protein